MGLIYTTTTQIRNVAGQSNTIFYNARTQFHNWNRSIN